MSVRRITRHGMERWIVDVDFKHATGERKRVRLTPPLQTRRGAEEYERQVRASMLDGTFGKETAQVPTVGAFKDRFVDWSHTNNKPSAVYAKECALKNHLVPWFGTKRLDQIGAAEIEEYKAAKLKEGLSAKSVNNHLAVFRKLLNLAVEWRLIDHAPKLKALRVPPRAFRFLEFSETERFVTAAPVEWRPMLVVALKTGLRLGELLALRWEDVDLKAGRLVVRRSRWNGQEGTPKGGRSREVPLSEEAVATLAAIRHLKGPYVFSDASGAPFTHSVTKEIVPRTCKRAGLAKRLTMHDLRHTFASHLVMRGVALKAVQELLGHATMDVTLRYAHLSPDVKRDAVRLLDAPSNAVSAGSSGTGTAPTV